MSDDVMPHEERRKLPADLTPLNIHAWLSNVGFTCGCSDGVAVIETLRKFLEWHDAKDRWEKNMSYETVLPGQEGAFYIIAAVIDDLGLAEHGSSIRAPWLTDDGKRLLDALRKYKPEEIDELPLAEAYDGISYGTPECYADVNGRPCALMNGHDGPCTA